MRPRLYTVYFLHALIFAFVISQFDFLAASLVALFSALGAILWRRKRPGDFVVRNYLPRVLVASTYALVFLAAFFLQRYFQPMNYRRDVLAAVSIFAALLAAYFATIGRR